MRSASASDVFTLVANDRCNTQLEVFGALDCSLQRLCWVEREMCTIALCAASTETRIARCQDPRAIAEFRPLPRFGRAADSKRARRTAFSLVRQSEIESEIAAAKSGAPKLT